MHLIQIKNISVYFLILPLLLCSYTSVVSASGLETKGIGARSRGMGFAMTAMTDEWSSVFYNPAAIGMIEDNLFGAEYEYFTGSIDSSHSLRNLPVTGANTARGDFIDFIGDEPSSFTKNNIDSNIHFGALGCTVRGERFSYGFGIYGSGSGTAWKDNMVSRLGDPVSGEVSYINGALNIPMVISYRLSEALSMGITLGINWGVLEYTLKKDRSGNTPYTFKTVQDTAGFGISTDTGVLWKPADNLNLGLVLKLPYTFKKTGDTHIVQSLLQMDVKSDTTVRMRYPLRASLGSAWQVTDSSLLAANITWLNWKKYNMKINYDNNIPGVFDNTNENPGNWENTVVANLGAEHSLNDEWKLRCGITYDQAPEPEESRTLTGGQVVDALLFSLGAGVDMGRTVIDFGYIYTHGPKVDGFIPGATYSLSLHELFVGTSIKF